MKIYAKGIQKLSVDISKKKLFSKKKNNEAFLMYCHHLMYCHYIYVVIIFTSEI